MIATSIRLDRTSTTPLYRQIYDQIKEAILTGRLPAGTRLPSSRTLAHRLAVGRITVTTAYERLAGEGFAQSRAGAGTSVAVSVPGVRPAGQAAAPPAEPERSVRVPQRVTDLLASFDPAAEDVVDRVEYDFRFMGEPFAMLEWRRMLARHWSTYDTTRLSSVPNEGDLALRQQIAQHLRTARGARCTAEQILVTNNVEHAVDLVAHLLLDGSDAVAVEDPCLSATQRIFRAHGARVVPVPIDEDGVDPDAVEHLPHGDVRLLCLMPSHQYPTGATLPLARRLRLLDWAARSGSLILEDDQYSEYGDDVPESMQGLDVGQVVLYIGTFQRLVASAVRVAYLVVPPSLVPAARAVQAGIDSGPPPFVQWALTEFMTSGLLIRHQRRIQKVHRSRRAALLTALDEQFGDDVLIGPARTGHHVHIRWRDCPATDDLHAAALRAGVGLGDVRRLYAGRPPADPGVTMAYGGLDEATIRRGVARLAEVITRQSQGGAGYEMAAHWSVTARSV